MRYQEILDLLNNKPVALIGVSSTKEKFGNYAFKTLTENGYEIYPIHRNLTSVEGKKCYSSIKEIDPAAKSLILITQPQNILPVLEDFKSLGGEKVWFQQGIKSPEALDYCKNNGLIYYSGTCILLSIKAFPHSVHKFIFRLFGIIK